MRPDDLPAADKFKHGTRAKYVTGCRCDDCRKANREYAHKRALAQVRGDWNGLVPAERARQHLLWLSSRNVGSRSVSAASNVARSVLEDVRLGRKTRIRARTEKQILSIDEKAISDHALVPAEESWEKIDDLLDMGMTKGSIAKELGATTPALQLGRNQVLAGKALKIEKLHRQVVEDLKGWEETEFVCTCGLSHVKKDRHAFLRRLLHNPKQTSEIRDLRPCLYGSESGGRMLIRDLHEIGAKKLSFGWTL